MPKNTPPTAAPPLWIPLSTFARQIGTKHALARIAIELNQVPVRTTLFGKRGLIYVHAGDAARYAAAVSGPTT